MWEKNPTIKGTVDVISSEPPFKGNVDVISSDPTFKGTAVDVISSDPTFKEFTIYLNSSQDSEGTIVYRALPSLLGESLEISL